MSETYWYDAREVSDVLSVVRTCDCDDTAPTHCHRAETYDPLKSRESEWSATRSTIITRTCIFARSWSYTGDVQSTEITQIFGPATQSMSQEFDSVFPSPRSADTRLSEIQICKVQVQFISITQIHFATSSNFSFPLRGAIHRNCGQGTDDVGQSPL